MSFLKKLLLSLLCLGALIIGCMVLFQLSGSDPEVQVAQAPEGSTTELAAAPKGSPVPIAEVAIEEIRSIEPVSTEQTSPAVSQLRRGVNNRLLLPDAVEFVRNADPSAVSDQVIFSAKDHAIAGHLTVDEHTLSAIEATMDVAALKTFLESKDGVIQIPLSRDQVVLAAFDRVISRGPHTTTIIGQVLDDSFSDILLVFHDGTINGSISFHDTNTHYQFAMAGNGDVAIRHLDADSFIDGCGNCENPEHLAAEMATLANEQAVAEESEGEVLSAPAGAIPFDSVIGYSAEARISDGGTASIEGRIIASVDNMNEALSNSASGGYFCSLLAMLEEPDATFSDSNFSQMHEILSHLNDTNDGVLDTLTDLRDELGADQATFVCNAGIAGVGGVANRPGRQAICGRNQMFSPNLVFAHEVGHNLGLRHGWGDSGTASANPKDQSNYGWRFDPPNGGKVRTIMAYGAGWGGSRIKYFSNPNVSYNGAPTGVARGFNATDTSGTPAYDQKFVLDGDVGGLGAGFDGSNPDLGARNGDYLIYNSSVLVNKDTREALAVLEPVTGTNFLPGDSTTIYWHGGDHTDAVEIDLYKDGVFQSTIATGLTGEERWYDWTIPSIPGGANFTVRVTLSGTASDDSGTFTIGTPVVTVPYSEGFEDGLGAWIQSPDDDFDWTRNSGGTPTANTGPTGASGGNWYLYIEPHDDGAHNKVAQIDCVVDMSGVSGARLSFDYHMYGENIEFLAVDVHDGTSWTTDLWMRSREQQLSNGAPWLNASVDLSAYDGNSAVTVRFRAQQRYWHVSDIAIDNIAIDEKESLPYSESFESGMGHWVQSFGDDYDWTRNSGGTETVAAGPDGASDGSYYLYAEGHDAPVSESTSSVQARFDFSTVSTVELTFDYHMYGAYIDYLALDVYDGSAWTLDVWIKDPPPQEHTSSSDSWTSETVDLSAYAGNSDVTLRFRTANLQWFAADPAIDNIALTGTPLTPYEQWSATAFAGAPEGTDVSATGNPDVDSLNNELEWFLGTDPLVVDSPYKSIVMSPIALSVDYTRRKLTGYSIYAQWSPDLSPLSWDTIGLIEVVGDDDGEVETVTVTAPISVGEDQKFIRIKVDEL
ncbi:MAG: M12 family metallo-peptidase [Opitutales bacterium]|jgi:hypothetical protein|nr:M12 family metallo-peptidase [Opitutales bacterium]